MGWLAGGATPGFLGPGVTSPMRLCACLLVIALLVNVSFCVSVLVLFASTCGGGGMGGVCQLIVCVQSLTFLLAFPLECQCFFVLLYFGRGRGVLYVCMLVCWCTMYSH